MDPVTVGALLSIANGTLTLARTAGVIHDEQLELARDTNNVVRSLIQKDFSLAQSKIVTASHTTDDDRQYELLNDARRAFEAAEATAQLQAEARAFSAAMCAALTLRLNGDYSEARRWSDAAISHYDRTFRALDLLADKAIRARKEAQRYAPWTAVPLGPIGGALGIPALHRRAEKAEGKVPSQRRIEQLNAHAASNLELLGDYSSLWPGVAKGLIIKRSSKNGRVKRTELLLN